MRYWLPSYGHFVPRCSQSTEKRRKLKDFYFSSVCEEGESPCTFDDQDHQNRNFILSKMVVSIIL